MIWWEGFPADSEYIIFIIDTSGSMFNYAWDLMTQKLIETLEVYPEVKGIQVMNDMGEYMFAATLGSGFPIRRDAGPSSRTASAAGAPSPIPLQWRALREPSTPSGAGAKDQHVFGDEFTGASIEAVIDTVDRINRGDGFQDSAGSAFTALASPCNSLPRPSFKIRESALRPLCASWPGATAAPSWA